MTTVIRRIRRLPGHLRPRRLRVYGIGHGKTGTTSLARMFGQYRSAHEVDGPRLIPVAAAVMTGELAADSRAVTAELRRRSRRFHLDVDAASFLMPLARPLVGLYPDARFVLTLRDCFSWLDSEVEQQHRSPLALTPMWAPIRSALYEGSEKTFAPEEAALEAAGLLPVACYLRTWSWRNEEAIQVVPVDRLLVVRTEDLDQSAAKLAHFAGAPPGTVHPAHANRRPQQSGILASVPREFIVARAQEHCERLMSTYWGAQWCDLRARLPTSDG